MSTEPEPQPDISPTTNSSDDPDNSTPIEPPPVQEDPPPPPPQPSEPIVVEPRTFYATEQTCTNQACDNLNLVYTYPEVYSNAGTTLHVFCGLCGKEMQILSAVKLDPQPELS